MKLVHTDKCSMFLCTDKPLLYGYVLVQDGTRSCSMAEERECPRPLASHLRVCKA